MSNVAILAFTVGQRVTLIDAPENETHGARVRAINISEDGTSYSVNWFNDSGYRLEGWFFAKELKPA